MSEGFTISYVPVPRIWCIRRRCGWTIELRSLDQATVARIERDHVAASHTPDDLGNSGP